MAVVPIIVIFRRTLADGTKSRVSGEVLLSCVDVAKAYGTTTALDRVNLDVRPGETLSVIGPSGCGKSRAAARDRRTHRHRRRHRDVGWQEVSGPTDFVPAERRGVGIVFQDLALFPSQRR